MVGVCESVCVWDILLCLSSIRPRRPSFLLALSLLDNFCFGRRVTLVIHHVGCIFYGDCI